MAQANLKLVDSVADLDAAFIIGKINEADQLDSVANDCDAQSKQNRVQSKQNRIEAGARLAKVQARLSPRRPGKNDVPDNGASGTSFSEWLSENGIAHRTAYNLIALATGTPEEVETKKAEEAARKRSERAAKREKLATNNSVCKELGIPEGGARVTIQNEVAEITGFREAKTPEQAERLVEVTKQVIAAKGKTLADTHAEIATLSETKQQQFARIEVQLRKQIAAELEKDFWKRVNAEVEKSSPERFAAADEAAKQSNYEVKKYQTLRNGIKAQLTLDDYRFLRQAIAPDRYPEEFRDKLTKAAAIINQFDKYVESFKV